MPSVRVATFNVENLLARFKFKTNEDGPSLAPRVFTPSDEATLVEVTQFAEAELARGALYEAA